MDAPKMDVEEIVSDGVRGDDTRHERRTSSLLSISVDELGVTGKEFTSLSKGAGPEENRDICQILFLVSTNLEPDDGELFLTGGCEELSSWSVDRAIPMQALGKPGRYYTLVNFNRKTLSASVHYKFLVKRMVTLKYIRDEPYRAVVWESLKGNGNRTMKIVSTSTARDVVCDVDVVLEVKTKGTLTFRIHYNLPPAEAMYVTGDPIEIGSWIHPGPIRMSLSEPEPLPTGGLGRFWTLKVPRPAALEFDYRYVIKNVETKSDRWEREPNRKSKLDKDVEDAVLNDVNFISNMEFNEIPPRIFIGPYPQSEEDLKTIKAAGATDVLCVQTDEDIAHRGLNWSKMLDSYKKLELGIHRWAIADFNPTSLEENIHHASELLGTILGQSNESMVYVHCTAGMSRAAATVILYLASTQGYGVDEAFQYVKKHRKVIAPNMGVLRKVAVKHAPKALERDRTLEQEAEKARAAAFAEKELAEKARQAAEAEKVRQAAEAEKVAEKAAAAEKAQAAAAAEKVAEKAAVAEKELAEKARAAAAAVMVSEMAAAAQKELAEKALGAGYAEKDSASVAVPPRSPADEHGTDPKKMKLLPSPTSQPDENEALNSTS
ncbi:hypothetical protein NDN08_000484 [Rhodosorus marinus]|uniref:Protein-tyrosine-phosphatase n=1 Tax=Rhodosorus marinus TaxID=101924 RepID=A0AAV8USA8_9RHOD|nr:hypothetical protein NDN08_000484 [Rhodosorus marinus]